MATGKQSKAPTLEMLKRKELKYFHFRYMFYSLNGSEIWMKGKVKIVRRNGVVFSLRDAEKHVLKQRVAVQIMKRKKLVTVVTTYAQLKEDCKRVEITIFKK